MNDTLFLSERYVLVLHSQIKNVTIKSMTVMVKILFGLHYEEVTVKEACTSLCRRGYIRKVPGNTFEITDLGWVRLRTIRDPLSVQYLQAG